LAQPPTAKAARMRDRFLHSPNSGVRPASALGSREHRRRRPSTKREAPDAAEDGASKELPLPRRLAGRQVNVERRPLPRFGLDMDRAFAFLEKAMHDGQSQS